MTSKQLDIFSTTTVPAPARERKVEPIHPASVRVRENEYFPLPVASQSKPAPKHTKPNPCVKAFGPGPDGKTCKSCCKLIRGMNCGRKHFKCFLTGNASGRHHRATWPACGKYVPLPPP